MTLTWMVGSWIDMNSWTEVKVGRRAADEWMLRRRCMQVSRAARSALGKGREYLPCVSLPV